MDGDDPDEQCLQGVEDSVKISTVGLVAGVAKAQAGHRACTADWM